MDVWQDKKAKILNLLLIKLKNWKGIGKSQKIKIGFLEIIVLSNHWNSN